jgi:hypothetical protein
LNEDEQIESIIEDLILSGALEIAGMDIDTGEPLYNFTSKMKSVNEELHNDLYTSFPKSRVIDNILTFTFIDNNVYTIDITTLYSDKSDIGTLYHIDNIYHNYSDSGSNQDIYKLRCGCEIHTSCFVDYIKHRLEDKVYTLEDTLSFIILSL